MTIQNPLIQLFAATHSLRLEIGEDDKELIIPGRRGHIYEHGSDKLGVILLEADHSYSSKILLDLRRELITAGLTLRQEAEFESTLLFDPKNVTHAKAAIRAVGAYKTRKKAVLRVLNVKGLEAKKLQADG